MPGLSDALTNKETVQTTLPSWYTTAQQNVVNQAQQSAAPQFGQTTGGQTAMQAFGTGQPYQQAASTLGAIATGAVNPWNVSTDATGAQTVTPNVASPLGGLFKSQTDYLTSMMPEISAAPTARAISGGGFGSSMNQAAVERARSQAINQLFQQQNQAALQGLQTGASAAGALGNLGQSQLQGALNLATAEQASPYASSINMANILSKMQQPTTQVSSKQLGALNQLGALGSLATGGAKGLFGYSGVDKDGKPIQVPGLLDTVFGSGAASALQKYLKGVTSGGGTSGYPEYDTGGSGLDLSGGDTSWIDETDWDSFLGGGEDISLDQPYVDDDTLYEF